MDKRLFIGNLAYSVTDEDLRTLFAGAGTVVDSHVVLDRDNGNRSKGFAFIEMSTAEEAQKAIEMFNGYKLQEREIVVNIAKPREERSDRPRGNFGDRGFGNRGFGGRNNSGGQRGSFGNNRGGRNFKSRNSNSY